ncbi:hypothetical protein Tco_1027723 [Tanacetum coccineum]
MFESGTYKSLPKHVALYEALKASMKRANRDEFLAKKDKSQKRRCDDKDPPPPLPDSYLNVPIPDDMSISDSEDTDIAHLPKIKTRPDWLKLVPEEDKPASPEPDWTGDMSSFVNWFCKRIGKKKLSKVDLEGPAFKVHIKMEMVSSCSGRGKFITACSYLTNTFKEIMKAQAYVFKLPQL